MGMGKLQKYADGSYSREWDDNDVTESYEISDDELNEFCHAKAGTFRMITAVKYIKEKYKIVRK